MGIPDYATWTTTQVMADAVASEAVWCWC